MNALLDWFSFPLMRRELSQQSARKRTYVYRVVYAIAVIIVCIYSMRDLSDVSPIAAITSLGQGSDVFQVLIWTQFCVLYGFLPAFCSGLITQEKERDTFATLLVTKLTPGLILVEKLLSRLIPFIMLLLLAVPSMAIAFSLGGVTQADIWLSSYLLIAGAVQVACISIACSALFRTSTQSFVMTYVFGGLFLVFVPELLARVFSFGNWFWGRETWYYHSPVYHFGVLREIAPGDTLARSLPIWITSLGWLLLARRWIVSRAFSAKSKTLKKTMVQADRIFEVVTGWKLRKSRGLPDKSPIAWRDTTRGVLGNSRYQFYCIVVIEILIVGLCLGSRLLWGSGRFPDEITAFVIMTFATGTLVICAVSTSLFSGERSTQTLDVLLTTPLSNEQILKQKFAGLRNLILMLLVPFLTFTVFFAWELSDLQRAGDTGTFDPYRNYPGRDLNRARFLLIQLGTLWIYPNMIAWLGILVGMRFRRVLTALTGMLLLLVAWCVGPFLILIPIFTSIEIGPHDAGAGWLFTSPLTVPGMNLYGEYFGVSPWLQAIFHTAFYFGCWKFFRHRAFKQLSKRLGRTDPDAPTA